MSLRVVLTPIAEQFDLRKLAMELVAAEVAGNMEEFQACLREPGQITYAVSLKAVPPQMHEVEVRGLGLRDESGFDEVPLKRVFYRGPSPGFREREFKPGGQRSYLLRHASSGSSRRGKK